RRWCRRRCRDRPLDGLEPVDDVVDLLVRQRSAVHLAPGGHVVAVAELAVGPAPLDGGHDVGPGGLVADLLVQHVLVEDHREVRGHARSEEHTSELQSRGHLVCRLLLEKKKKKKNVLTYDNKTYII